MRTALITARKHGQKALGVISGPDVPIAEQREKFKAFARAPHHPDFEEVQLWESDTGIVKRLKRVPTGVFEAKTAASAVAASAAAEPEPAAKSAKKK